MNYETKVDPVNDAAPSTFSPSEHGEDLDEDARRKRLRIAIIVGVVAVLVVAILLHSGSKQAAFAPSQGKSIPVVSVIVPTRQNLPRQINVTGTLAARRDMPVGAVGTGGNIVSVPVDAGDWVRAGQVLAVIDPSVQKQVTASTAAQVKVAEANAQLAQGNLDRGLKLVARGFISKADIDKLRATRDAAVAQVQVAKAQLGEQRARDAQLNIVAPAAGLVLQRKVEPGQVVSPASGVLFSIAKGGRMELLANVGESDLAKIKVGDTATVTPVGSDKSFTGHVWQISPVIDQTDRQGTARIALAYNPDIRPGGFASATIDSGTLLAPKLPESAILSDSRGSYVYIVGKDDKVVRRDVKLGMVTANGIAITSGLTGKEEVVARAGAFLAAGQTVKPVMEKASD